MITADKYLAAVNSPVRRMYVKVELFNGSTLTHTFTKTDRLINFSVERIGEDSKFFGFGICQRLNIHLIDMDRELDITTANSMKVYFGTGDGNYVCPYPTFYVSRVNRDENTNELSVTAYDRLYDAATPTVKEIVMTADGTETFTLRQYANAAAALLDSPVYTIGDDTAFDVSYSTANYNGDEPLREALDDIAEVTQTIYYMDCRDRLMFRVLDRDGAVDTTITKDNYFTLDSGDNRRLTAICHATELGDNIEASLNITGTTQYVRNNAFWEMDKHTGENLDRAMDLVGGMTINQFECSWRGNYLLEIGDKLALVTKDNEIVVSYLLDDVITYDGSLKETTRWKYSKSENETATNPTTIGDALNTTFARVDKVKQEVELHAERSNTLESDVAYLKLTTESITAGVENAQEAVDELTGEITKLNNKVNATMSAEDVKIEVLKTIEEEGLGATITTSTGFTFNEEGLTVSKSGSEMKTQITEDGMVVKRNDTAMLTANNTGVEAVNLHAKTYLWIGKNSRFEDYQSNRTGCFWVG